MKRAYLGPALLLALAAAWGAYLVGPVRLDVHSQGWLWGDLAQVQSAWMQFMADSEASWLSSARGSYPIPISVSLFDPMPILLLLAKPFAALVPEGSQYFGLYFLLCYLLQAAFGYLTVGEILRWCCAADGLAADACKLIGGLLFACLPFTLLRMHGHTALSSQWLLVLSIWVALRSRDLPERRWFLANGGVLLLACGFNPYLALMVGISLGGFTLLHLGWPARGSLALRLPGLMLVGLFGLWMFGFLSAAAVPEGGYGQYSMNMLGPIDSNGAGLLLALNVPDPTGGQTFEGFSYLGAGVLALCSLGLLLCLWRRDTRQVPFVRVWLLIVLAYLLALSTTLTLSGMTFQLPVPEQILELLSRFRASGRFFWIGAFWLLALSIATLFYRFSPARAAVVLAVCLLLQLVDISRIASQLHTGARPDQRLASPAALVQAAAGRERLILLPPWQCDHQQTPGGVRGYEIFGIVAAQNKLLTNSFYAARTLPEQMAFHCDYAQVLNNLSDRSLYVLSAQAFALHAGAFAAGYDCSELPMDDRPQLCVPRKETLRP